ncbi:MAG: hypothetical protein FP816_21550 [Desulfobacteraceae bacterium]|nr:hypothetical protein [Desulfobacteraceae bacterium]MBU4052977.1 dual specificity protein phosphatase family protein [Pseudomonadota bacterium]
MSTDIIKELRFGFIGDHPLAGMGEPWASKMETTHELLRSKGIGGILTLTEDDLYGPKHIDAGFLHFHEPVNDCEPPTQEGMDRALAFIGQCLDQGAKVAVHCFEGRGRTGTILTAWLAKKESLSAHEAILRIHELRWHTVLTPSQRQFLSTYLGDSH